MNKHLIIRKSHRFLGVFLGIQFLMWTVSGLYFSWNNIDNVHGDHMRKQPSFLSADVTVNSPMTAIQNLKAIQPVDSIHSVHLIRILGKPVYQISYFNGHVGEGMHLHTHYALADAITGEIRQPITKEEATQIALEHIVPGAAVSEVNYLKKVDEGHHEYREKPLPAWAVSFKNPDCTVYISAELGNFQTIRHDQWRTFDFLWMTHVMGYESRDDLNNWLLKILSVLGLVTVLSGFTLFIISYRPSKK